MSRHHEFVAEGAPDRIDLGAFEAVLDRIDRKAVRQTLARQGVEMPFQPGLRFKQHAFRLKFLCGRGFSPYGRGATPLIKSGMP